MNLDTDAFDREFVALCRECYADPLRWVRLAFPWGKGELADEPGPDEWQTDFLTDLGKALADNVELGEAIRMATASGHGIGKSALVAWLILWAMSTRPNLAGVVTANTQTQLETKTWRELSIWHKRCINAHWFEWTTAKFYQVDHPETWFVAAIPWQERKSEAFAGQHGRDRVLIIYDEASAVHDAIWEVSEGATTDGGALWFVFGNPTKNTGRFRECFGRFRARWRTRQIDSRTARRTNKRQIQQWIDDYGVDSDFVRVRVLGVFPRAGDAQFIASDVVEAAASRILVHDSGASLVMGVDVARFGSAESVIRYRCGRDARSIPPKRFRIDTMQLVGHVANEADHRNPEAIFIDGNGVGGGVVDRLKQLGYRIREVQFGGKARNEQDYGNKRAECWGDMRLWLPGGCIDAEPKLRDDLIGPEYRFDRNNRIMLESKEDMVERGLASPDDGDALALTFAEPVARADSPIRRRQSSQAITDYALFG